MTKDIVKELEGKTVAELEAFLTEYDKEKEEYLKEVKDIRDKMATINKEIVDAREERKAIAAHMKAKREEYKELKEQKEKAKSKRQTLKKLDPSTKRLVKALIDVRS